MPDAPVDIEIGQREVANLPESLNKIIGDMELAAMAEFEVHKGRLGFAVSPIYYKGKDKEHFTGPAGVRRELKLKETVWLIDYAASYEIGKWKLGDAGEPWELAIQPYVGATYFHDPIKIRVSPGLLDRGLKINKTIEFNTPMVSMETHWTFNDSWTMWIGGHYGGFDVDGVDELYQAVGMMAYHFKIKETSSQVFFGYKFIHLEYEDDSLKIHVDIKGPLVGFGIDF